MKTIKYTSQASAAGRALLLAATVVLAMTARLGAQSGASQSGNIIPASWFWEYFGRTDLSDNDLDSSGKRTLLTDYQHGLDPNLINFSLNVTNQYVRTRQTTINLNIFKGRAFYIAVAMDDSEHAHAVWMPCTTSNVDLDFGTKEGWHEILIGLTGHSSNSMPAWQTIRLKYDPKAPALVITNPVPGVVMQPMIELQGYSPKSLRAISYDLANSNGYVTRQQVLVSDEHYDTNTWEYTTNTFQAYDVPLTPGLNRITLHATDVAGNETETNVEYTLDYSNKTNPPVVKLYWPKDQSSISTTNFTWRGHVDDPTVRIVAQVVATNGDTRTYTGLVERDGDFWVEDTSLSGDSNRLSLKATDAAGNVTTTNIVVSVGPVILTVIPPPSDQLWNTRVTVTGTINLATGYVVWVNGAKAIVNTDGTWMAKNVPVTPGGTAVFEARAISVTNNNGNGIGGSHGGAATYENVGNPE